LGFREIDIPGQTVALKKQIRLHVFWSKQGASRRSKLKNPGRFFQPTIKVWKASMFYPLELFIGLRYTRAKRRNHFISFISVISILGIAIGVATLITVLSVMNGFEKELRERILGMVSHATISPIKGGIRNWEDLIAQAREHPLVIGAAPYIEGEGLMKSGASVHGVSIRGVLPDYEETVSEVAAKMIDGSLGDLAPGGYGIVLGRELALLMGAGVGDDVILITPQANVTPVGVLPRMRRFTVVGVFEVGMEVYDSALALMHMQDAAALMRLGGEGVSGIRLKLSDMMQAREVASELTRTLDEHYWISDWTRQHVNFFKAVQMEKRVMFVILTLILTVAVFNIVSTLVMVVTDKQSDIAILRTLGLSPGGVMKVFMIQGVIIGFVGALAGVVCGSLLALNAERIVAALEHAFHVKFLSPDVYYISNLPSDLHWSDVGVVGLVSFVLSVLATLYPAWRAAKIQPAEALRYE
jgi:lipoprotein-releasing system permease protein